MDNPTDRIEKVADLIENVRMAFLTTVSPDGSLHARPMAVQRERFDGHLYFFTARDSAKVQETNSDQQVSVTFADPSQNTYVAISGRATTYRDEDKIDELWSPFVKTWFPQGKDDPNLAILRVDAEHIEYWDAPSSTFIHLYGIAKATLTGTSPDPGEHQAFDVNASRGN